ncbi:hypothetical protein [Methylocystis heyeri]|uniref:hypothetical protein n=1 Tax=Methylocystis heyeri TaxID=391905 RepID=UPI0031B58103
MAGGAGEIIQGAVRGVARSALAHAVGDKAEQPNRCSSALEKRRELMTAWADFAQVAARRSPALLDATTTATIRLRIRICCSISIVTVNPWRKQRIGTAIRAHLEGAPVDGRPQRRLEPVRQQKLADHVRIDPAEVEIVDLDYEDYH